MSTPNHTTDETRNRSALLNSSRDICRQLGIAEPDLSQCQQVVDFVRAIDRPDVTISRVFNLARRKYGYQPAKAYRQMTPDEIEAIHKLGKSITAHAAAILVGRSPRSVRSAMKKKVVTETVTVKKIVQKTKIVDDDSLVVSSRSSSGRQIPEGRKCRV